MMGLLLHLLKAAEATCILRILVMKVTGRMMTPGPVTAKVKAVAVAVKAAVQAVQAVQVVQTAKAARRAIQRAIPMAAMQTMAALATTTLVAPVKMMVVTYDNDGF
jgi:hypothetical protein